MASKTIMIQEITYNKLKKLKQRNESFNALLLRLMERQQDLTPFFGLLSDEEGEALDHVLDEARIRMNDADRVRLGG
jgi:predicted CopG family antitoxin